ncbi:hypothetical protein PWT90_00240 [Aphanocladium album]|nr:hypothetical protein PWT90_00240 [Aphanocladium album]
MAEVITKVHYHGNCWCGMYRFELLTSEITSGVECTCRQCRKKGYRWLPVSDNDFTVVRDDGSLAEFDSGVLVDKFCKQCGNGVTGRHSSGPLRGQLLININLIMELDPFKVGHTTVDTEEAKQDLAPLPAADPPAVQIQDRQVRADNCSFCSRLAYVGSYEPKDVVRVHGKENTFECQRKAQVGKLKMAASALCKTCGVHMFANIYGPPLSFLDKVAPERLSLVMDSYVQNMNMQPISVRVFDDVDMSTVKVDYDHCGTEGYALDD